MREYTLDFDDFQILASSKFRQKYISDNNTQLLPTEFVISFGLHPPYTILESTCIKYLIPSFLMFRIYGT